MRLQAQETLKTLMSDYFKDLAQAGEDPQRKVAWCTSAGPVEILRSFGFDVFFPENHGALLGASRKANSCIPHATSLGYSPQICSYLTSDIGSHVSGNTPLSAYGNMPPRPDLLLACDNQCREVEEWFGYYARAFSVPLIIVRTPKFLDVVANHHLDFTVRELGLLVEQLETITGRPLDRMHLADVVDQSAKACRAWKRCLQSAQARPSPLNFFDGTILMAPIVIMRGLPIAVDFYQQLDTELRALVDAGTGSIPRETFRLYWEGMPIWGRLRALSESFSQLGASIVASTYCNSWIYEAFDGAHPLESLAKGYTEIFINRSESYKEDYLIALCRDFSVDGIIYHDAKTCPYNSNTNFALPERVQKRSGLPFIVVEGDLNDLRCFSDEQAQTKFETFAEQLEQMR